MRGLTPPRPVGAASRPAIWHWGSACAITTEQSAAREPLRGLMSLMHCRGPSARIRVVAVAGGAGGGSAAIAAGSDGEVWVEDGDGVIWQAADVDPRRVCL